MANGECGRFCPPNCPSSETMWDPLTKGIRTENLAQKLLNGFTLNGEQSLVSDRPTGARPATENRVVVTLELNFIRANNQAFLQLC